jgi:hypothetical protein
MDYESNDIDIRVQRERIKILCAPREIKKFDSNILGGFASSV